MLGNDGLTSLPCMLAGSYLSIVHTPLHSGLNTDRNGYLSIKWGSFGFSGGKETIHTICTTNGSPYQSMLSVTSSSCNFLTPTYHVQITK